MEIQRIITASRYERRNNTHNANIKNIAPRIIRDISQLCTCCFFRVFFFCLTVVVVVVFFRFAVNFLPPAPGIYNLEFYIEFIFYYYIIFNLKFLSKFNAGLKRRSKSTNRQSSSNTRNRRICPDSLSILINKYTRNPYRRQSPRR